MRCALFRALALGIVKLLEEHVYDPPLKQTYVRQSWETYLPNPKVHIDSVGFLETVEARGCAVVL